LRSIRVVPFALLIVLSLAGTPARAGGPLFVRGNGVPFVWSTAAAISYRTDDGPLSASVNEESARARVDAMFDVWQNVATSSINYARAGFINATGAFGGGDVNTADEFAAVDEDCADGNQSPIVYDADATIFIDMGLDETSVIGFAGPCAVSATQILSGLAVMNGLFQDGQDAPDDLPAAAFDAALIHEFGHFSGLDHSQVNVNCLEPCSADDLEGLPTMFPLLVHVSQGELAVDDIAWISRLYPQAGGATTFAGTHGTITGVVFFSDGQSHAQFVNVIARRTDTGNNEDRTTAVSVMSGFKFTPALGNPIIDPDGSPFGSRLAGDIGLFEIPVPAGNYTVEVESIDESFTEGSSIGGFVRIAMPGTAPPPIGPINVAAGVTIPGNDMVLIGTDPRFDQFEGP
jgi:hypothetical protein